MEASVQSASVTPGNCVGSVRNHRDPDSGYLKTGSPDLLPWEEKKSNLPTKSKQDQMSAPRSTAAPSDNDIACSYGTTKIVSSATQSEGWSVVVVCVYTILFALLACTIFTVLDKAPDATVESAPAPGFVALVLVTIFLIVAAAIQVQKAVQAQKTADALAEADINTTSIKPAPGSKSSLKQVHFGHVDVREHAVMVGGSGVVITDGAPLGLGWGVVAEHCFTVDEFESERWNVRRHMDNFVQEGWVSAVEREKRLLAGGVHPRDLEKISKVHACTQRLRTRSNEASPADRCKRRILHFKWRENLLLPSRLPKRLRSAKVRASFASSWGW